ncbi:alpha/beta hydrolase [Acaryochloris sp. CCMEE 5410]|nr:alpha/beta hydrolase [Acaryochloris sp. CCMEE 5410]
MLIHGMGRTPLSMLYLQHRLRKLGHTPHLFGYSPTLESLQTVTDRLVQLIQAQIGFQPYALLGHSLGTIIIRSAYPQLSSHPPAACFFLAPPMMACQAAKFFSKVGLYRLLTGEMGQLLAQARFINQLTLPPHTKIYVGTGGPRASWLPFGNELNDGILTVAEASDGHKVVTVPAIHTFIMNSTPVFEDIAQSLEALA